MRTGQVSAKDEKRPGQARIAIGEEQMAWLREDVEQARANGAEWIVLNYHKPLYSKSYHSLQDEDVQKVREELTALIDELDIDLALQGHDHVISRTHSLTHVPSDENFSNAEVEDVNTFVGDNGVEYMENPDGTVYVLPNTGGTKEYDDVYSKGVDHLHEVRPDLDWMTEEDVNYYNSNLNAGKADMVWAHGVGSYDRDELLCKNYKNIKLDPRVQVVMHMDGHGDPVLKKDSYHDYIQTEPVQYTGFKLFYEYDPKPKPHHLMTPTEVLTQLTPKPLYIQYQ